MSSTPADIGPWLSTWAMRRRTVRPANSDTSTLTSVGSSVIGSEGSVLNTPANTSPSVTEDQQGGVEAGGGGAKVARLFNSVIDKV
jgi:hypothetical protein